MTDADLAVRCHNDLSARCCGTVRIIDLRLGERVEFPHHTVFVYAFFPKLYKLINDELSCCFIVAFRKNECITRHQDVKPKGLDTVIVYKIQNIHGVFDCFLTQCHRECDVYAQAFAKVQSLKHTGKDGVSTEINTHIVRGIGKTIARDSNWDAELLELQNAFFSQQ